MMVIHLSKLPNQNVNAKIEAKNTQSSASKLPYDINTTTSDLKIVTRTILPEIP